MSQRPSKKGAGGGGGGGGSSSSSRKQQKPTTTSDPNSPESFEAELKALAAKAKQDTFTKHLTTQLALYFNSLFLLTLAAAFSVVSQLTLSPVYGSIPSGRWHSYQTMAASFIGWSSNVALYRHLPFHSPSYLLPVIALWIPTVQFFLFKFSGVFTAWYGPSITEGLTYFPLMTITAACVATYTEQIDLSLLPAPKFIKDAIPGLGSYSYFLVAEKIFRHILSIDAGESFVKTRIGAELGLALPYVLSAPSKLLLWTVPALVHTALWNTHVQTPMALASLNTTLVANNWAILDRKESLTGYISVVESLEQGFRVLRCDHSLLGGEWVKIQEMPQFKDNVVGETIYGVFAMLEAVRLVKMPEPIKDSEAKALVIGMGVGTTPAALVAHGIDTTVVEIDPVVHEFAAKYFKLPEEGKGLTTVIQDAVTYTSDLSSTEEGKESFDYIIHDVFTGGAEPIPLFTLDFLQTLEALLKPGGVVAINYAGDFSLPPPAVIIKTIRTVFPTCRIFREHEKPASTPDSDSSEKKSKSKSDFDNIVIFCTKLNPALSGGKIEFRRPTERDMLNSPARQGFLVPKHEVLDRDLVSADGAKGEVQDHGILTANDTEKLARWHEQSALGHWAIMRVVLPPVVWENW
ncbi:polyamine aminopropyltransferase [Naviculisporaceae sp. PSN 640]